MKIKMWHWLGLAMFVLVLTIPTSVAAQEQDTEKSYSADRFDVDITVREDGSLAITETVVYRFVGGPFTFVFRELQTEWSDGLGQIEAAVDGRVYPPGENAGQVEVSGRDPVRIEWHFEPVSNATRTFTLSYVMSGVVRQTETADLLRYQPLPDEFEFPIGSSTITVNYPFRATPSGAPMITAGQASVSQGNNRVTLTATNIQPNETLVFDLPFTAGSLISTPPQWQQDEARRQASAPIWWVTAATLLFSGIGGAVTMWQRQRPIVRARSWSIDAPPSNLPPALSGALVSGSTSIQWHHALAALFDLAQRGYLEITELPKKAWYQSTDFLLRQTKEADHKLRPHESALLTLLFEDKKGRRQSEIKLSKVQNVVSGSRWKQFTDSVKEEMATAGYLSDARQAARMRLFLMGGFMLFLSVVVLAFLLIWFNWAGAWPVLIFAAIMIVSVTFFILGSILPTLTDEAAELAADWQQYFDYLKSITKGKSTVMNELFVPYLPYATAAGLLTGWVKRFEKQGNVALPPYFHFSSAKPSDGFAAFVVLANSSASSGGAAAGAAAGGAAGGGAAGAG